MNSPLNTKNETQAIQLLSLKDSENFEFLVEHYGSYYWRPRVQAGEFRIGYTCLEGTDKPPTGEELKKLSKTPIVVRSALATIEQQQISLLKEPDSWSRVFPQSPNKGDMCIYRAIAPEGYVALSDIALPYSKETEKNPDLLFRCVHKALVQYSEFCPKEIWKDNESTWNIQGTGFFMWNSTEQYPNEQPYALSSGSILSNLKIKEIKTTPGDEGKINLTSKKVYKNNYVNNSTTESTHTFTLSTRKSRSVTTNWEKSTASELGVNFGLKITVVTEANVGVLKIGQETQSSFDISTKNTFETSIGEGENILDEEIFSQQCVVKVAPQTDLLVEAYIFTATYDIAYEGELILDNKVPGSDPIYLPIKGTLGYAVDTNESWWEIGEGGTFLTKEKINEV